MAKNDDLLARLNNKEDNFTERKLEGAGKYEFRKTIVAALVNKVVLESRFISNSQSGLETSR